MKTLHLTPSHCSLRTVTNWEWESEEEILYYLYWSKYARSQLIKTVEAAGETVVFGHPLLQTSILLHPGNEADYIQDLVEYELSVHYPQFS